MAREVSSADAKRIVKQYRRLIEQMTIAAGKFEKQEKDICAAAKTLAAAGVAEILKNTPVDELNREGRGVRIKTLKEHGFHTLADLQGVQEQRLAGINGISAEGAAEIRRKIGELASRAEKQVRIKLNTDDRNPQATKLVSAIYAYKVRQGEITLIKKIRTEEKDKLEKAIRDIKPATGGMKWMFATEAYRERAVKAYQYLSEKSGGGYAENLEAVLKKFSKPVFARADQAWEDFIKDPIAYTTILEQLCPELAAEDAVYGLPEDLAMQIGEEPIFTSGLFCSLRRYQEWGVRYILHQRRVLLGDEMGLGKTVQAIASMVSLTNCGGRYYLVIVPASVVTNWVREIRKHSTLDVVKIHGADRAEAYQRWREQYGVAVTTFETTEFLREAGDCSCEMVIIDEAHYIKNPEAKRSVNTKAICAQAERLLFMTGTALENRVEEMIELVNTLQPAVAAEVKSIAFMSSAPQFREKIAPVYYRRRRDDVLKELPELIENKEWCVLSEEEETLYEESVLNKKFSDARRVSWNVDDLRQSSKAQRLKEIIEDAEEDGRKVIVFSFFLDTIAKIGEFLGERCMQPINGSVHPQRRQEIIDEFDKAPAGSVLLAQIQSGGTGLNIQSASVVVLCEPQFKPSIENQAISRAYRMGQTRNVLVYRLLADDTVDEKIMKLLEEKQQIFDMFADESVVAAQSIEIDEKSFGKMMNEEAERIETKRAL